MDDAGMDRLLRRTAGALSRAWAAALQHLRDENPVEAIADRLRMPALLDWRARALIVGFERAFAAFAVAEHNALGSAGQAEAEWAAGEVAKHGTVAKKLLTFDPADPSVLTWAERNRLDLISGLTFEQRSLIRAMLIDIDESGTNPLVAARQIYDALGLTPAQEAMVQSYRVALERGEYADALRRELSSGHSDRVIATAQRERSALSQAEIDTAVARYRRNVVVLRAETIARTESQRIAHQGSDALYRQAIARGDIAPEQVVCEWLHSPRATSEYARDFHRVMHGQQRAWGEPFVSGLGNSLRFPGDPNAPAKETLNCRCTRTVRIRPGGGSARAA